MQALVLCDDLQPQQVARKCQAEGYGIEIQSFYDPEYFLRTPDAIALHQNSLYGVALKTFHGPFGDLCPGSFDVMVRDLAKYRYHEAARIASQLGAKHLILHHGYVPHTSRPANWLDRCTRFWTEFLQETPDDLAVHLENHLELDATLLSDLIDAVGGKRLDVCLDIGHTHCLSQWNAVQWIEHLADRIGYVHLHDNHGQDDEHLALGQGNAPLLEACQALEEHAPKAIWAIETKPAGHDSSLAWLRDRGFLA